MIQHYSPREKSLTHSQKHKIQKILENKCLRKIDENHYKCYPIPGYNKNIYDISRPFKWDKWQCNCQYYTMTGNECAHIAALKEYLKQWGEDGQRRLL